MEAQANLKFARMAPRKLGVVADLVRGKNVGAALADDDARASGVDVDLDLVGSAFDLDLRDARVAQRLLHELADLDVFVQPLRVVLLLEPLAVPGLDDAETETNRMDFLTQSISLRYFDVSASVTYTWAVFLLTRVARPIARGMKRRLVGPWSTWMLFT